MTIYTDTNCSLASLASANDSELEMLVNKGLHDCIVDTFNACKKTSDPRKLTIEISMVRNDDIVSCDIKIQPKLAAYSKIEKPKQIDGQTALDLEEE